MTNHIPNGNEPQAGRTSKEKLKIATYNIKIIKIQYVTELDQIKLDILRLREIRLPVSGYVFYSENSDPDSHHGGVAILLNKKREHFITKFCIISNCIICITRKLSQRYTVQNNF